MIYVSSCCVKANSIKESVKTLVKEGIKNIELTGGTRFYPEFENDLLDLQNQHEINYLVHNYFPPPHEPFILNLATLNNDVYDQSIKHCKRAIALCKRLGSRKYGIHDGFLIDFTTDEVCKKIKHRALNDRHKALDRFVEAWNILREVAGSDVMLYVENNVFSSTNSKTYDGQNPFFLTDYDSYLELQDNIEFNLLLDLAHLKVSVNSLNLSFQDEANKMMSSSDYIHLSGNDGLHDLNFGLEDDKEIMALLNKSDLSKKTITVEVYDGINSVLNSIDMLKPLIN